MAEAFHELHGDYVENAGQQISLREYLDYFEPLGSALARLPDGTGGPFVHHFTDGAGHTISAMGWVVSAKSKRFGGWKLWGMWTDRPMPPVALPLFWGALSDPARVSEWVDRANEDADRLLDPKQWPGALGEIKTSRLREAPFRELLKAELARAYAVPLPHRHPIEIEVTPATMALLPWLYLLGPVDPVQARLQPNRFNGPGYQYILADEFVPPSDADIPAEIDTLVDAATKSTAAGWRAATELRARREHPPRAAKTAAKTARPRERSDMRSQPSSPAPPASSPKYDVPMIVDAAWKIVVLLLLLWIAWNVYSIRKAIPTPSAPPPVVEAPVETPEDTTTTVAPRYEPDLSNARLRRIASALSTRSPRGVRINASALADVSAEKLARVAVEIFLRRSGCLTGDTTVDGKFSTAEQRAIRNCATLQDEHLMKDRTEPDAARAIDWLEELTR
jgi:hypothetical protein